MNVQELMGVLSELDPEAEVRLTTQPSWPLQCKLRGVASNDELRGEDQCERHGHYNRDEPECAGEPVVWLVEGGEPSARPTRRAPWGTCATTDPLTAPQPRTIQTGPGLLAA